MKGYSSLRRLWYSPSLQDLKDSLASILILPGYNTASLCYTFSLLLLITLMYTDQGTPSTSLGLTLAPFLFSYRALLQMSYIELYTVENFLGILDSFGYLDTGNSFLPSFLRYLLSLILIFYPVLQYPKRILQVSLITTCYWLTSPLSQA